MNAKVDAQTLSDEIKPPESANINELTVYYAFSAGCSAGAIQLETAHQSGYTGTWSPEGSPVTFGDGVVKHVSVTGVAQVRRCRISTAIVGGTVSIWAIGR